MVQVRQKALPFLLTFNCCSFLDSAFPLLLSGQRLSWWFGLSVAVPLPLCHGSALPCGSAALGHRHCLSLLVLLPLYKIKKDPAFACIFTAFLFFKRPCLSLAFSLSFCAVLQKIDFFDFAKNCLVSVQQRSFPCISLRLNGSDCCFSLPFVRLSLPFTAFHCLSPPFTAFHRLSPRHCCSDRRTKSRASASAPSVRTI